MMALLPLTQRSEEIRGFGESGKEWFVDDARGDLAVANSVDSDDLAEKTVEPLLMLDNLRFGWM